MGWHGVLPFWVMKGKIWLRKVLIHSSVSLPLCHTTSWGYQPLTLSVFIAGMLGNGNEYVLFRMATMHIFVHPSFNIKAWTGFYHNACGWLAFPRLQHRGGAHSAKRQGCGRWLRGGFSGSHHCRSLHLLIAACRAAVKGTGALSQHHIHVCSLSLEHRQLIQNPDVNKDPGCFIDVDNAISITFIMEISASVWIQHSGAKQGVDMMDVGWFPPLAPLLAYSSTDLPALLD